MPEKTMRDAINEALHQAMEQDDSVFVIGEDVAGCSGSAGDVGAVGGVFGVTEGIYHRWPDRCIDTPISESAIVGAAAGAALVGMRPVAEIMFADFIGVCMDQIVNQMAKFRYMFGGKVVWECERIGRFYSRGCLSAAGLAKQPGRKQCHTDKRQHGDESNLFHYGKILGERRDGLPSAQRRQVYG